MGIISIILTFIVVGLLCWLAVSFIPMPAEFKRAIPAVALVLLILWVLFGLFGGHFHDVVIR